ncbi:Cytochrome P450 82G1 [Camellia lanceoleosa]|uniref:Cytochrome P450 82G1 n=1 Tax=Camellia lanceoleosa TaxID=1840588 RepID=A0ACC0F8J2_9ERIC|nr:Cytochrome P450 82G1 [Camellia lanceoleosa]
MITIHFLTHFLAITVLVPLLLHFYFWRTKHTNEKNKSTRAPEPSGSLPIIGHLHLLRGETPIFRTLGAMADKYGPVYSLRLGGRRRALVVSSWEAVKDCFTTNDTVFATRPAMAVSKNWYDNAVFAIGPYGDYWRNVRKIVTLELLTNHRLEKLRHVRESEVNLCITDLHLLCVNNGGLPTQVTMNKWFDHLTFNVIVRMLAGKRFSGSTTTHSKDEEGHKIKEAIKKALYLGGVFVVSDEIPWLEWFDFGGHLKAMKQTLKEVDEVLGSWLEEHIQKKKRLALEGSDGVGDQADFMDVMLSVLSEDTMMGGHDRDTVIKATTMILIMTGSESTGDTLIWALSLLLNNRQALKTAQAELDAQVGRHKWVQESDIQNLKYLQAIVKETLRLYPPGPVSGPREAMEDCRVGGYRVDKGTRLIVNLWKLHRDERVWSNPEEFEPQRFLKEHADVGFKGQQHFEYIPFSSGRRMCPGLTFGLQLVHLTLARLIHGFDLGTPMEEKVDMTEGLGIALPKVKPVEVVLTPRLPSEVYQSLVV